MNKWNWNDMIERDRDKYSELPTTIASDWNLNEYLKPVHNTNSMSSSSSSSIIKSAINMKPFHTKSKQHKFRAKTIYILRVIVSYAPIAEMFKPKPTSQDVLMMNKQKKMRKGQQHIILFIEWKQLIAWSGGLQMERRRGRALSRSLVVRNVETQKQNGKRIKK